MEFCRIVNEKIGNLAMNGKLSYNLERMYARCRNVLMGMEYYKDKQFSNTILRVTALQPLIMDGGDKLADRYGGKGVVSLVLPDKLMPLLDNGKRVEIIKNQGTCINRENKGQIHEQSLTFIGMRLLDAFESGELDDVECAKMWYDFVSLIDADQANKGRLLMQNFNSVEACHTFIESVKEDEGIILSSQPFTTNVNIDTIRAIYDRFPWIEPYKVMVPMEDSNGDIRYVPTRRKLIVGKIYNYRLKQYAEEKFSVTSLSATNLKNLNTRSRANKIYETKHTKTPIMFGFMESCDLAHVGMQYVVMNLMLYSSSPQARRLFENLLIGNPYQIDIRLDQDSRNRNAEIINALFKTMGLRLVFTKRPKEVKWLCHNIMYKTVPNKLWVPGSKTNLREIIGMDDVLDLRYATAMQRKYINRLYNILMMRGVNEDGSIISKTNLDAIFRAFDEERLNPSD